jgi:hypothetical protein
VEQEKNQCQREYERITIDMPDHVPGLTEEDYERSMAHVGNRYRIAAFVQKLIQSTISSTSTDTNSTDSKAVTVIVCGGSITMGHGVEPQSARYSDALEVWLNEAYPVAVDDTKQDSNNDHNNKNNYEPFQGEYNFRNDFPNRHRVFMRGGHGANVCVVLCVYGCVRCGNTLACFR